MKRPEVNVVAYFHSCSLQPSVCCCRMSECGHCLQDCSTAGPPLPRLVSPYSHHTSLHFCRTTELWCQWDTWLRYLCISFQFSWHIPHHYHCLIAACLCCQIHQLIRWNIIHSEPKIWFRYNKQTALVNLWNGFTEAGPCCLWWHNSVNNNNSSRWFYCLCRIWQVDR